MTRGNLIIVSGPSGSGKSTVVKELVKRDGYALSISVTTRKPRPSEIDGKDYFFITKEQFEKKIEKGDLLEFAEYNNNFYGTPKDWVLQVLESGKNVILEIEVQGGLKVKAQMPESIMVMFAPPTFECLKKRLRNRGDTSEKDMERRLSICRTELSKLPQYDYIVVNYDGKTEDAVEVLHTISNGCADPKHLVSSNPDFARIFYEAPCDCE